MKEILKRTGLPTQAEDCSITPISQDQLLISNIDIFTAIHDDPFTMGQIAACNVTNDLFALNALNVSNFSNFMGFPTDIPDGFPEEIILGMRHFLQEIGTDVHGGHTIFNPWPLFGGSASAVMHKDHLIEKQGAKPGDRLIITKPLGVQPVMAAYRVKDTDPELLDDYDSIQLQKGIDMGVKSMTMSNHGVVKVIHHGGFFSAVTAMTDVTGFGLSGHLDEMIENQDLGAHLTNFPVIPTTPALAELMGYQLEEGRSPEIAGAMLMAVDSNEFLDFTRALSAENIWWAEIGEISESIRGIKFDPSFKLVEIDDF
ncbi:MAG: selenide, water dikinase SelD [Promethearchaeota archaeon]